jgi:putative ATPase
MLEAGEDPRFIMRRVMIHASEDVGMADPSALLVAVAADHALERLGLPEARIPMAQAVIHVATAPKSNSTVAAIDQAQEAVRKERTQPVPKHLRDAHYKGAAILGNGIGYLYPHDYPDGWVAQSYMPYPLKVYHPTAHGREKAVKDRVDYLRRKMEAQE